MNQLKDYLVDNTEYSNYGYPYHEISIISENIPKKKSKDIIDIDKIFDNHDKEMLKLFSKGKSIIFDENDNTYLFKYNNIFYHFIKKDYSEQNRLNIIGLSLIGCEKLVTSIYLSGGAGIITPFDQYFMTEKMTIINDDHKFFYTPEGEFFEWEDGICEKSDLENILKMMIICYSEDMLEMPQLRDITWKEMEEIQQAEIEN